VFHHILGDYGCILPVACLTQKRVASNAAQSEIERTKGRRFALLQEPGNDETINIGYMKELSGGDMIQARGLFREPIEFRPQFTMVLTCNELPYGGTWRRIRAVPFLSKFVEKPRKANEFPLDCEIEDNLKDVWGPTLLSYLVHVCETMPRDATSKRFIPEPQIVLQQTNKYKMDNDPIAQYIDERITIVERRKVELKIATIFTDFRQWAIQNRAAKTAQSRQVFEKKLKDKLKEIGADFFSIAIKEEEDEDESDDEDVPIEVKIERWFKVNFQPVQGADYIPIPTKTIAQFFIDNVMSDADKRGLESTKISQDVQKGISAVANKTGMVVKTDMVKVGEKRTSIRRLHNGACAIEALKHM
jgi:phage/plasmid-associated DNA primase